MNVNDNILKSMIRNVNDPNLRALYGNIIDGSFPFVVRCMNPQRDGKKQLHERGKIIGYIDSRNRCVDQPEQNEDGKLVSGIETSRDRFDGRKGFRCYCGNWSIQCEEEQGVLKQSAVPMPPTKDEMAQIFAKLQKNNHNQGMVFVDNKCEYDGFLVERVER